MKFAPMLAQSVQPSSFDKYISDDGWVAEQKLDGKRLLLRVDDGVVTVANRSGEITTVNHTISAPFTELTGSWCFDGEEIHGQYWIFDMPYALDIVTPDHSYEDRRNALEAVFGAAWTDEERLKLIDVSRGETDKRTLLEWCESHEAEGVMFKNLTARYMPGKRSHGMLKAKFTDTVECVIMEISPKGKSSVVIGLFEGDNALPTEVTSVKMTERNLAKATLGAVIECRYLYLTKDNRLYQTRFLKYRTDKSPHECLLDGTLRRVNKTVREIERNTDAVH